MPDGASESQKAASRLERAMRPIPRLIVLHRTYRHMKDAYRDVEKRVLAPASPRKGCEATQEAMRQLFEMQRVADHLVREYSPALAQRRGGGETAQQAILARAAAMTSQIHSWRRHMLGMERAFQLSSAGHHSGAQAIAAPPPAPTSDTSASAAPTLEDMPVRGRYPDTLWQPPQ